jgi:hypothetical protein
VITVPAAVTSNEVEFGPSFDLSFCNIHYERTDLKSQKLERLIFCDLA